MPGLSDYKKNLSKKLFLKLKVHGFKKNGNNFHKEHNDLLYFISVQSSQSSTHDTLKCTINTGITSKTLYRIEDTSIPEHLRRHYDKRIGWFLPGSPDKWWTITNITDEEKASDEIAEIMENFVLPELFSFKNTDDLVELWKKGFSPGLTNKTRREYLTLLTE